MSIGSSGRIVIEVEPEVKRLLYSALAKDGMTLKDWFLKNLSAYLDASTKSDEMSAVHRFAAPGQKYEP